MIAVCIPTSRKRIHMVSFALCVLLTVAGSHSYLPFQNTIKGSINPRLLLTRPACRHNLPGSTQPTQRIHQAAHPVGLRSLLCPMVAPALRKWRGFVLCLRVVEECNVTAGLSAACHLHIHISWNSQPASERTKSMWMCPSSLSCPPSLNSRMFCGNSRPAYKSTSDRAAFCSRSRSNTHSSGRGSRHAPARVGQSPLWRAAARNRTASAKLEKVFMLLLSSVILRRVVPPNLFCCRKIGSRVTQGNLPNIRFPLRRMK